GAAGGRPGASLPGVRQLPEPVASPQRAEDVERLAHLPDGLRARRAGGRLRRAEEAHRQRRAEAPAGRAVTTRAAAAVALALACGVAPAAAGDDALHACRIAGIRNEVVCGQVMRPLDPATPGGA